MPPFLQLIIRRLLALSIWIIRRRLIPNSVGAAILQATIAFVGLGGQSAWGMLLSRGRNGVRGLGGDLPAAWWVFLPATLAIVLFGVGWNLFGDGLTKALDPKQAG